MAGAGHKSQFVEIHKVGGGTTPEGQPDNSTFAKWTQCYARVLPVRGGEDVVARGTEVQTTIRAWFDYYDVMDPIGDGVNLNEGMVIQLEEPAGWLFNIIAVHPDYETKRTVQVDAVRASRPV